MLAIRHGLLMAVVTIHLAWLAGCSVIVSDNDIRCELQAGQPDPCPEGRVCLGGACVRADGCAGQPELCNGLDDDCDDRVDEGHDRDGDGFTWCGGGVMDEVDCDDEQANVHPASPGRSIAAAQELCDTRDNDCDGNVDEGADAECGTDEVCVLGVGCVAPDCTRPGFECPLGSSCNVNLVPPVCVDGMCTPGSCPNGAVCDEGSGSCVSPVGLGEPCVVDSQCGAEFCGPAGAYGGSGDVCMRSCCSDADCPSGRLCWASGTGARVCVTPGEAGLVSGTTPFGSFCTSNDQCASGVCKDELCSALCANDATCEEGVCRVEAVDGVSPSPALTCDIDPDGTATGDGCTFSSCESGLCVPSLTWGLSICSTPCGTTDDCPDEMYCGHLRRGDESSSPRVQACIPSNSIGPGLTGDTCDGAEDCRDQGCLRSVCADRCCDDDDCSSTTHCRPVARGEIYEMRCI